MSQAGTQFEAENALDSTHGVESRLEVQPQAKAKRVAPQIQRMRAQMAEVWRKDSPLTPRADDDLIVVDQISRQLSHFYEKMRYSVDYKEEHLLRRGAIKRMLKRRILEQFRTGNVGHFLVIELVRAGYLPNNALPVRIIDDVDEIITKARQMILSISAYHQDNYSEASTDYSDRIIGIAAMEIEEYLFPLDAAHVSLDTFYLTVKDLIDVQGSEISEEEKSMQIYVACTRSLLGYDESDIYYMLWNLYYPQWRSWQSWDKIPDGDQELATIVKQFDVIDKEIDQTIKNQLNWRIMPKIRDYAIYFSLIRESLVVSPDIWSCRRLNVPQIRENISSLIARKYDYERSSITKSVNRAIIYIVLTKTVLAFAVELPYDLLVKGRPIYSALMVNVFFHPALLYVITRVIRLPQLDSRQRTVDNIIAIIENTEQQRISISAVRKKSLFGLTLSALYVLLFVMIFASIVRILDFLNFNIVSGGLFIFFLTLVTYFALRIRARASKWHIRSNKLTAVDFLVDLLTLPIALAGRWISKKFETVNIFVFVMDFLIETPFKVLIDVFEGFTRYLQEKKEQLE